MVILGGVDSCCPIADDDRRTHVTSQAITADELPTLLEEVVCGL